MPNLTTLPPPGHKGIIIYILDICISKANFSLGKLIYDHGDGFFKTYSYNGRILYLNSVH